MNPSKSNDSVGRTLAHGLLDVVGRAIITGQYDSMPFPTEAVLAKQQNISRSVTREAVKMLTAKGLLSGRPKQGTIVQPPDKWNLFDTDVLRWILDRKFSMDLLRQFTQLRIAIEPQAAALAAESASAEDLAGIERGLNRMAEAERGEDDVLDADIAFHIAILNASNNPFFVQFRAVVETALRTSIRFTNRIDSRGPNVADHGKVFQAIAGRDPALAWSSMRDLIAGVFPVIDAARSSGTVVPTL